MRIPIGKGEILRAGQDLAILAIGATVYPALGAAERLASEDVDCAVASVRFAKPLDTDMMTGLAATAGRLLTVEENSVVGGFGSGVLEFFSRAGFATKVECMGLPDIFIEHGSQDLLRSRYELDSAGIAGRVKSAFPELFTGASTGGRV
jgi:1-deoxy-D-xylulose-5-phosphate synthase